jgi:hypothetical protein
MLLRKYQPFQFVARKASRDLKLRKMSMNQESCVSSLFGNAINLPEDVGKLELGNEDMRS